MKNIGFILLLILCSFMPQKTAFHSELDDVLAKAKKLTMLLPLAKNLLIECIMVL